MKEIYQIALIILVLVALLSYISYTLQKTFLLRRISKSGLIEAILEKMTPTTTASATTNPRPFMTKIKNDWIKCQTYLKNFKPWKWMKKHKFWTFFILICIVVIIFSLLQESGFFR